MLTQFIVDKMLKFSNLGVVDGQKLDLNGAFDKSKLKFSILLKIIRRQKKNKGKRGI